MSTFIPKNVTYKFANKGNNLSKFQETFRQVRINTLEFKMNLKKNIDIILNLECFYFY